MTGVREGKDIYCGCSEKGYEVFEIAILTLIAIVFFGILMFTVSEVTSPSRNASETILKTMDEVDEKAIAALKKAKVE